MNKLSIFLLVMFLPALFSCSNDGENTNLPGEGEAIVEISLLTSNTRSPAEVDIEGGTEAEKNINTLDLLVFKNDQFQYRRYATKTGYDPNGFKATLKVDNGLTVYFLANARKLVEDLISSGKLVDESNQDWETIRALLIDTDTNRFYTDSDELKNLPMWSMEDGLNVVENKIGYWTNIGLMRAVAGVDIYLAKAVTNFTLDNAYLYFVPDVGSWAPLSTYDLPMGTADPESAPDMETTITMGPVTAFDHTVTTEKCVANKFYLYDNDTDESTFVAEGDKRRYTRIVVGGTYNSNTYYYPIDFMTLSANNVASYDKISRNIKYVFNITEVSGPGYPTSEIASKEPPVHMTTHVKKWNVKDDTEYGYDGVYYVSIESRKVYLNRDANSSHSILFNSNAKNDVITLEFANNANGEKGDITNGIKNDRFSVEKVLDSGKTFVEKLKFTALGRYDSTAPDSNEEKVILKTGNMEFEVSIIQLNSDDADWENGGEFGQEW